MGASYTPPMDQPDGPRHEDPEPGGRILAFDLARGLAVVFMILVHVLRHWGDPSTWTTPIGTVISTLGGPPAAPVFMFVMGASIAFSRRTSFGSLARRGLWLIAAGYLLNIARGTLPLLLGSATGVVTAQGVAPFTPLSLLVTVDILQLAGCSLVLMAALRAIVAPGPPWLVVAAGLALAAPFLHGLTTGLLLVDAPLGMLWATGDTVYYPVFPWAVFPLVGAVVGGMLAGTADRAGALRRVGAVGLAAAVLGGGLIAITATPLDITTYWRLPPVLVLAIGGFVVAWLWVCDIAVRHVGRRFGLGAISGWSSRVTTMYVIHWLIVSWGIAFVGFRAMGLWPTLVGAVAVLAVTIAISQWRPRLRGIFSQPDLAPTPVPVAD
jgi:uncharacterized membrane protein